MQMGNLIRVINRMEDGEKVRFAKSSNQAI
jgi:hypothetical protein